MPFQLIADMPDVQKYSAGSQTVNEPHVLIHVPMWKHQRFFPDNWPAPMGSFGWSGQTKSTPSLFPRRSALHPMVFVKHTHRHGCEFRIKVGKSALYNRKTFFKWDQSLFFLKRCINVVSSESFKRKHFLFQREIALKYRLIFYTGI